MKKYISRSSPIVSFVLASSILSFPNLALADTHIENFIANGDGCPPGSFVYQFTPDKQTLQILYSNFIAELAPIQFNVTHPPTRNCTISFKIALPPGISVSWYRTEHRGFADTSGGAQGQFWTRYYLPGTGGFDAIRTYTFPSGQVGPYTVIHENLGGSYTPCGGQRLLSVNTRVRLYGRTFGYNTLSVDDETQSVETILRFRYRSCY
jgi:hypothetical protein